jgi:hypothetical protein
VYVSSLTHRVIRGEPEFVFGEPALFSLKGFDEPEAIYELDWRREVATMPALVDETGNG